MTAPARYSPTAIAPAIDSSAMTSTPKSRRASDRATAHVSGTSRASVVAAQQVRARPGSPNAQAIAPASAPVSAARAVSGGRSGRPGCVVAVTGSPITPRVAARAVLGGASRGPGQRTSVTHRGSGCGFPATGSAPLPTQSPPGPTDAEAGHEGADM